MRLEAKQTNLITVTSKIQLATENRIETTLDIHICQMTPSCGDHTLTCSS